MGPYVATLFTASIDWFLFEALAHEYLKSSCPMAVGDQKGNEGTKKVGQKDISKESFGHLLNGNSVEGFNIIGIEFSISSV